MTQIRLVPLFRLAKAAQAEVRALGLGQPSIAESDDYDSLYDQLVTEPDLVKTTRSLFSDGYYALAVEEAFKCLNNIVKQKSGLPQDGASLMRSAFSANGPVLRVNNLRTQSERDQQLGYMDIFAGCMTGIRNPRAHEHRYLDKPAVALEMLSWANHLIRIVDRSIRTRRKRKKAKKK